MSPKHPITMYQTKGASSGRTLPRVILGGVVAVVAVTATFIAINLVSPPLSSAASPFSAFDVPAGIGADVPFVEYEAEEASTTGVVEGPDVTQGTLASEASGRRYVRLSAGQHVEFTLIAPANAVTVAYNVERGASGTVSVYLNGNKIAAKLPVTSKYSYVDTGNIAGSKTHHLFDHARMMFGTEVASGGTVRLQVDAEDIAVNVDVADFELVGPPAEQPAGSISVTDSPYHADPTGQVDATAAFNQAIAAARAAGTSVWIPAGTFAINAPLQIDQVTMQGAGPWYSVLHGTHLIDNTESVGPIRLSDFAAIGEVGTRNDGSPDNFINGSLGTGSSVTNVWIQHQKVGLWLMGSNTNLTIENNRILDTTADAINFNGRVTGSVIRNNFIRNTGDDAIALWSLYAANAGNTVANNTIVQPNLANGIAVYGGRDNTIVANVVADTNALGSGIAISNQQFINNGTFAPLAGTITIADNYLIRAGAMNPNWHHPMGAIRFDAYDFDFSDVSVNMTGGMIIDSPYSAIEFVGGDGTGRTVTGVTIDGVTIANAGTVAFQAETKGSASITNVAASGLGVAAFYNCSYPPGTVNFTFDLGMGNSGLESTWDGCDFPERQEVPESPGSAPSPSPAGAPVTAAPSTSAEAVPSPVLTRTGSGHTAVGVPVSTAPQTSTPSPSSGVLGDLALHRPVTASGHTQTYVAENAVDSDANTYWESPNGVFPQWFQVDLGATYGVTSVVIGLPPLLAWGPRTQTVAIEGSADGVGFSPIVWPTDLRFELATGNVGVLTFPASPARYLRLIFTANTGWPGAQIGDLAVYSAEGMNPSSPGNPNLAAGKRTYGAGYADIYVPKNITDGSTASYWESPNGAFPRMITVDLGAVYRIGKLVLALPPGPEWWRRTQTIAVLTSVDGVAYADAIEASSYTFDPASGNTATATLPATDSRFVRLVFTGNTGWPGAQLSELSVYEN